MFLEDSLSDALHDVIGAQPFYRDFKQLDITYGLLEAYNIRSLEELRTEAESGFGNSRLDSITQEFCWKALMVADIAERSQSTL